MTRESTYKKAYQTYLDTRSGLEKTTTMNDTGIFSYKSFKYQLDDLIAQFPNANKVNLGKTLAKAQQQYSDAFMRKGGQGMKQMLKKNPALMKKYGLKLTDFNNAAWVKKNFDWLYTEIFEPQKANGLNFRSFVIY